MGNRFLRGIVVLMAGSLAIAACSDLTGSGGDDGPVRVEWVTPSDLSTGVSVLSSVQIRFSTRMAPDGLATAVRLEAHGRPVLTEMWLTEGRTLELIPTDPLDFGVEYRLVVDAEVRSLNGSVLGEEAEWTFTTQGTPLPAPHPDTLRRHLGALAHDTMRGRGSGSEDELKAAHYLAGLFDAYGLEPPPGGSIQPFEAISRRDDQPVSSRNVLASLPGSGPLASEWIVVGAHYDHVGFRGLESEIGGPHNGADDNASGTALVVEMARLLGEYAGGGGMADLPHRSVLFVGFGAEEEGLLGSCHYVFGAPAAPLGSTRAMLNFDMVGRLREGGVLVSGQETASSWGAMVANANAPDLYMVRPPESAAWGTDHACFWQARIPWVGFFTGFHPEYHAQEDDTALINFPGLSQIGELGLRILVRLMVAPDPPRFEGSPPPLVTP
jgi:hypothetical protein